MVAQFEESMFTPRPGLAMEHGQLANDNSEGGRRLIGGYRSYGGVTVCPPKEPVVGRERY